jgi:hypothetical protein
MAANVLQAPCQRRMPLPQDRGSRLVQIGNVVYFESGPLPDLTGEPLCEESRRTRPRTFVFLLGMAVASLAREVSDLLISSALRAWFGVNLDPFTLSLLLQLLVTLVGIGLASRFWHANPGSTVRRHILLAPIVALGIGLILSWLSHFVGYANALDWPLVLIYLLWAGTAALLNA